MIDKLTYDQVLIISSDIKKQAEILSQVLNGLNIQELNDFIATVEGYSKYLETTVKINKDADKALEELIRLKK